jgi:YbgC/YbaW family acyl-CoA thioester hydrolase
MLERESGLRVAVTEHRVTMADVDRVQAHFGAYFRWMDAGFHALLTLLSHPLSEILAGGHGTPVVDVWCSYLAPVGLDDVLTLRTAVASTGVSSFIVEQQMCVKQTLVARARTTHVWITLAPTNRSTPLPEWLREARTDVLSMREP